MRADEQYRTRVEAADERRTRYLAEEVERAVEGDVRREVQGPLPGGVPQPAEVPGVPRPAEAPQNPGRTQGQLGHGGGGQVQDQGSGDTPNGLKREDEDDGMGIPQVPGSSDPGGGLDGN